MLSSDREDSKPYLAIFIRWGVGSLSMTLLVIQVIAQLMMTRRWFKYSLCNKDFRVCHPLFACGNFASVHPNHQKCARAPFARQILSAVLCKGFRARPAKIDKRGVIHHTLMLNFMP